MCAIRSHKAITVSLFLSYSFIILLCTPFAVSGGPSVRKAGKPMQEQPPARYRAGEVLVRFREGVQQKDKDSIIKMYGTRQKRRLRGDSNFEQLKLTTGRDAQTAALELLQNPQVQFAEPGSFIKFNADLGTPAPGFRLGLPTLQQRFLDSDSGIYAYILVTPSGGRVELRQVGTSNIYESQDGSYTQLDASNSSALIVRTTDGTQMTYVPVGIDNEFRCTQIKDRNGNYISATYNTTNGHLLTVTDTLNRLISFNYDGSDNLTSISQTWAGVTHYWATFYYGQVYVAPLFGGGLLVNGPNNNYTTVLTQVNLHDGSYFIFNYNAAFAQVNRINQYASDGRLRTYTSYNVSSSSGQTECPRFTERGTGPSCGTVAMRQ